MWTLAVRGPRSLRRGRPLSLSCLFVVTSRIKLRAHIVVSPVVLLADDLSDLRYHRIRDAHRPQVVVAHTSQGLLGGDAVCAQSCDVGLYVFGRCVKLLRGLLEDAADLIVIIDHEIK